MALSADFPEFAQETFAPFGDITIKKMFGGAGVYCEGLFFALLDDDVIYLKVDDETRAEFEAAGLKPFTIAMKDGASGTMSYYNAPEDIFDDADALRHWTGLALDAARRAAARKPKKKKTAKNPKR